MSQDRALLKAIVATLRDWKFRYTLLSTADPYLEGMHLQPLIVPDYLLKYRAGACLDYAALMVATLRHFKVPAIFVMTKNHAIAAIARDARTTKTADIKGVTVCRTSQAGSKRLILYPVDVSSSKGRASLKGALSVGRALVRRHVSKRSTLLLSASGRFL